MCLILLAHRADARYPLVLAGNRDEFYERPTARAAFWDDAPDVLAGRDLRAGGTWLGVTRAGRWAAVTNYRDPPPRHSAGTSRGGLVAGFLQSSDPPDVYLHNVARHADDYDGFNLLVGDVLAGEASYFSNRDVGGVRRLNPGVYGLSNQLLDTPWPKVVRGKRELAAMFATPGALSTDALLHLLYDMDIAGDHELPDTGVGLDWERVLSASFVVTPAYGTRCSTAVLVKGTRLEFVERTFTPATPTAASEPYAPALPATAGKAAAPLLPSRDTSYEFAL